MFRAKSMTRAARLPLVVGLTLAAAACDDLELTPSALAAPAPVVAATPPSAPASPLDRLEQLDQLHADLEVAKLRASIAKANAEARDAGLGPVVSAAAGPPLPQLGPSSPLFNLPQIAPPGPAAAKGNSKDKDKADSPAPAPFTLVEAWGAGSERQAIIRSDAGDRLVRVGDQIPLGVITAISGGAVTYRDPHGQPHAID